MRTYSKSTKDGKILIQTSLDEVDGVINGIRFEYNRQVLNEVKFLRAKIITEIKKIIKGGGNDLPSKFSWSYWQRKMGQKNFSLETGKNIQFDNRYSHRGKEILRLPVHPTTYMRLRQKRTAPRPDQFALIDTETYLKSFLVADFKINNGVRLDLITNFNEYFTEMENGFDTRFGKVKRPHIEPALINFNKNNKKLLNKLSRKLSKTIDKNMKKVRNV